MLVRAIERLGSALVDMRHAPDPRILVEVALVQLTADEVGTDTDALLARIERLEQTVKQLREPGSPPVGAATAQAPRDPATGRAVLGGAARRDATGATPRRRAGRDPPQADAGTGRRAAAGSGPLPGAGRPAASPHRRVAHRQGRSSRAWCGRCYSAVEFVGDVGGVWQFSVPNDATRAKCAEHQADVEAALTTVVGAPVTIEFVVGAQPGRRRAGRAPEPSPAPAAAADAGRTAPSAPSTVPSPPPAAAVDDDVVARPSCRPCPTTTTSTCPSSPTPRPSRSRPRSTGWPRRSPAPSS